LVVVFAPHGDIHRECYYNGCANKCGDEAREVQENTGHFTDLSLNTGIVYPGVFVLHHYFSGV
jgi:hypothetical protein